MSENTEFALHCPIPLQRYPRILMAHGGGGRLMHQLIDQLFLPALNNNLLQTQHDGAVFDMPPGRLAFTTDSYVVQPIFFEGGDIGKLAVCGTVNDLAMCGAKPLYLSLAFILEEGLPTIDLCRVVDSIRQTAQEANVQIVTGDTKVVEHNKMANAQPGMYINTSGIGVISTQRHIAPSQIKIGDQILLSGDIGRHGISIMTSRHGLEMHTPIASDVALLHEPILQMLDADVDIHCLRDLTRGGLATALYEIASAANLQIAISETEIPVCTEVRAVCEILGLDPLYVANEGRFVAIVNPKDTTRALDIMCTLSADSNAKLIGEVYMSSSMPLIMHNAYRSQRALTMLSGEQLPRIC
jgi:hydrogenase expression/formation protein HypE